MGDDVDVGAVLAGVCVCVWRALIRLYADASLRTLYGGECGDHDVRMVQRDGVVCGA